MDWSKGYSAAYYIRRVDPTTWRDMETIEITGGSVKRELTGLRESADIECSNYHVDIEQWIRVYMDTIQGGSNGHTALFTGLATSPCDDIDGVVVTNTLECYSVLKPAEDVLLPRGWYAAGGRSGSDIVKELLSVSPAPITVAEGAPRLSNHIIAEDGETRLSMADKVLEAINWRIRISGDGSIGIEPAAEEALAEFDPVSNDIIEPQIKVVADWYACPNVVMAIADDLTAIARDESDGPLSVTGRGREVWLQESGVDLADSESIADFAKRRLKEAQTVALTASYDRRYIPDLIPGDMVRMRYQKQGLNGVFRIDSQSIDLGYNARTSEEIVTTAVILDKNTVKRTTRLGLTRIIRDSGEYIVSASDDYFIGLTRTEE